eukprot:7145152-Pyramimonas_sp.AAC.1
MRLRGPESGGRLMICAAESLASGTRLLVSHRTEDGTYAHQRKTKAKTNVTMTAANRITIAYAMMRFWRARGSGGDVSDDREIDDLRLANVYLNYKAAQNACVLAGGPTDVSGTF